MVIWIIGLSGAGKTTLAQETVRLMRRQMDNVVLLDGDAVRSMLGDDLGHTLADRKKNADRLCRMGRFLDAQNIHVVCAVLSVFEQSRRWNRQNIENYYEVYIDAPLDMLEQRDPKGLYARARRGEIADFPGVSMEFPVPRHPDLVISNNGTLEGLLCHAPALAALAGGAR
jgi:adenylylsulfate kinase